MQTILRFLAIYREAGLVGSFIAMLQKDSLEKLALIKSLGRFRCSVFFCNYVVFCLFVCVYNKY